MRYAYFDSSAPQPTLVKGWYDTGALSYPSLPAAADLLELTDAEWADRMSKQWCVENGALTDAAPYSSLADTQAAQVRALTSACAAAIVGGHTSSALGAAYTYPTKVTDQANMSASVLASLMPGLPSTWTTPFWCEDSSGVWAFRDHTAAQIQQAGADLKAFVIACQQQLATLTAEVMAATTTAAVQAITWTTPS